MKDPKTGRSLIDLVLAEKHIVSVAVQQSFKNGVPSFSHYTVKEEAKFAFNTGFKDAFALYKKLPDIITDFKQAFVVREERLRFNPPVDESRVIIRKVVSIREDNKTFLIFLKCDSLATLSQRFKIHIFEQASSYEETFSFKTAQILTKDEMIALAQAMNDQAIKSVF